MNNKFSKTILSPLLLLLFLLGIACNRILDVKPANRIDLADAINTPADAEAALIGMYAGLDQDGVYGSDLNFVTDLLAGNGYVSFAGSFQNLRENYKQKMLTNNQSAFDIWSNCYNTIGRANFILSHAGVVTDSTDHARTIGEALFIRGALHFELVRLYARQYSAGTAGDPGVPIITFPTTGVASEDAIKFKVPRNTIQEVYNQVISDLKTAVNDLPTQNPSDINNNRGRANKYVAQAFLARVYLQMGDYANAGLYADSVLSSGQYTISTDRLAPFVTDNTAEAIFELQQNAANNAGQANGGIATFYGANFRAEASANFDFLANYDASDSRLNSWFDGNGNVLKWQDPTHDYVLVRAPEMYLIRAEASLRTGTNIGGSKADDDINAVRTAAGLPTLTGATVDDVFNEKALELSYEGQYLHDLRRFNMFTPGGRSALDDTLLLPIPLIEIQTNPKLVQNTAYN